METDPATDQAKRYGSESKQNDPDSDQDPWKRKELLLQEC